MALTTYDGFIKRVADGYWRQQPIMGERAASTASLFGNFTLQYCGDSQLLNSSLPTGVTSLIPTRVTITSSQGSHSMLIAQLFSLGTLDISGPTFVDGVAMPTVTELGSSRQLPSPIAVVVDTVLNATPGSLTVTYKDQDNNSAETTTAQNLTGSAAVGSADWVVLNSPDTGAIDITAATTSGGTSPTGVLHFYGVRPLALIPANLTLSGGRAVIEDLLCASPHLCRLGTSARIGCFAISNSLAKVVVGDIFIVGDS